MNMVIKISAPMIFLFSVLDAKAELISEGENIGAVSSDAPVINL